MKILILNYEFPPLGGGAANATYYLLKEFSKYKDLEIDLVTSSVNKFRIEKFAKNITIHFLDIGKKGNLHYQSNKDLLSYSLKSYNYCKKLMKDKKFDLVHAFFGIPCGYIAMKLKNKFDVPYIVSLRGSDVPEHNPKFKVLDKLFFKKLSRKIWRNADSVIVNSEGLRQEALKTSPKQKIKVIYNGIDTKFYKKIKSKKNKEFTIIFVGRLSIVKGLDYLFKAFSKLKEKNKKLVLIGDGDQKNHLEKLAKHLGIKKQISFEGIKNKKELVEYYSCSNLFVLASINEGMSNTILEAMACNLPIIATDVGGSKELIKGNGLIVEKANSEELRKAIEKLLSNNNLLKSMGIKSRKLAEKMNWEEVAREYMEEYEK